MGEVEIHLYGDWRDLVEKKKLEAFYVFVEDWTKGNTFQLFQGNLKVTIRKEFMTM